LISCGAPNKLIALFWCAYHIFAENAECGIVNYIIMHLYGAISLASIDKSAGLIGLRYLN